MSTEVRRWVYLPDGWVFLVYGLAGGATAWWLRLYPAAPWADDAGTLIALLAAIAGVAWVFTTLLWLLSNRSAGIFHGVYLGLLGCGLLGALIVGREAQFQHDREMAEQIRETRLALRRQALVQAREALAAIKERRAALDENRFLKYEGRVDAATLEKMRSIDEAILGRAREGRERWEEIMTGLEMAGPEAWLRFSSVEELQEERETVARFYEATRTYLNVLNALESDYQERLEEAKFTPPADRYAVAEMERVLQTMTGLGAVRLRELDVEIAEIQMRALDLLLQSWGQWRFQQSNSRIVFDDPGVEIQFMEYLREAVGLVDEQVQIEARARKALEAAE
jgi:hypothetical protein